MPAATVRLNVETLDPRNAPSDLVGNTPATTDWLGEPADADWLPAYVGWASTSPQGGDEATVGVDGNAKPVITEFKLAINPGWVGVFSGKVTDESVSTVTIRFGGSPDCLQQVTTSVTAGGTFSFQGQLVMPGDTGTAWAEPVDAVGSVGDPWEVPVFGG